MAKLARLSAPKVPRLHKPSKPDWLRPDDGTEDVFEEMTLSEHLIELRTRIVRTCFSIGGAFILGVIIAKPLLDKMVDQAQVEGFDIQSPTDPITLYFKIALYVALVVAAPLILMQMMGFIAPGLTRKEKRVVYLSLPWVAIMAVIGASYGFFVAAPRALYFLSKFMDGIFSWDPDGKEVIGFYLTLMLGLALAFQIPIIMFIFAKLNIVTPKKMASIRRYAFVIVLILSAVITPSTDPVNMAFVAVPLYLLYEFGIIVARLFAKTPISRTPSASAA